MGRRINIYDEEAPHEREDEDSNYEAPRERVDEDSNY